MAKTAKAKTDTAADGAPRSRRTPAIAAGALSMLLALGGGAYVVTQPSHAEASAETVADIPVPMPVSVVAAAHPVQASDYEIVSIYGGEAILAAGANLIRVKVGSTAPALGTVLEINPSGTGGTVVATEATLRSL